MNVLSAANMIDAFQSALRFAMVADDAVIYHHVKELVSIRSKARGGCRHGRKGPSQSVWFQSALRFAVVAD